MNKTSIKVIKRKDVSVAASVQIRNLRELKQASGAAFGGEKTERRLRRKMADTVSNWIAERREDNRTKEISAIRRLFGDESLLSKTA